MELMPLGIEGSWLAHSPLMSDKRGYFREWFKVGDVQMSTGRRFIFEQANISQSSRGTVRGIHYSMALGGQAKWVTCVTGSIRDIIVDIRPNSKTFGQWIDLQLTSESGNAVLIGEGLGHAFVSLEEKTTVAYLVSSGYSPKNEFTINPLDSEIQIDWGMDTSELIISDKDKFAPTLSERKFEGRLPLQNNLRTI
jgi:dTDP-4-dehydrorhamnose 3,5-epimerase